MSEPCKECGAQRPQTAEEFEAERNDTIRGAFGLLKDLGFTAPALADVLEVASFLAGEQMPDVD